MTPRTESPIAPETNEDSAEPVQPQRQHPLAEGDGGADDSRQYPGRVRGQRLEITSADLTMYSFITGRAPSSEERERALTWAEADPAHDAIAAASGTEPPSTSLLSAGGVGHGPRLWHPSTISLRVREIWFNGITLKTARPQITHWLRRLSCAIQEGTRRVTRNRAA
jgi:hypothetical protein